MVTTEPMVLEIRLYIQVLWITSMLSEWIMRANQCFTVLCYQSRKKLIQVLKKVIRDGQTRQVDKQQNHLCLLLSELSWLFVPLYLPIILPLHWQPSSLINEPDMEPPRSGTWLTRQWGLCRQSNSPGDSLEDPQSMDNNRLTLKSSLVWIFYKIIWPLFAP